MAFVEIDRKFFPESLNKTSDGLMQQAEKAFKRLAEEAARNEAWLGWYNYPRRHGFAQLKDVQTMLANLPYHDAVVVIGIGGSYLGSCAVYDALRHTYAGIVPAAGNKPLMIFAGHHLSETGLAEVLDVLAGREPVVNVISKSGTTTEPAIAFRVIRDYLQKRFGAKGAADRILVTTDADAGALRQMAEQQDLRTFPVPNDIGGRYSVLTAVGLVPLGLAGLAIERLMEGADDFFSEITSSPKDHPALRYACDRQAAFAAGMVTEFLVFADPKLRNLCEWWRQLFGESQGKDGKGLQPAALALTTDLHSMGQFVQDGPRNLMETFLSFTSYRQSTPSGERQLRIPHASENLDGLGYLENRTIDEVNQTAMQGTRVAHFDGGVPCLELRVERLNEYHLGGLLAFFQVACAVGGYLLEVDPFDQPAVEIYKKNLFGLLGKPGFEEVGAALRRRL